MTNVFTQRAKRFRGQNALWLILACIGIAGTLAAKYSGFVHWPLLNLLPAIFIFLHVGTRKRKEEITFFVNRSEDKHFYFTYKDEDKQRMDDVRIDEYDYWYYTNGGSDGKTNYVLVMQAGDENGLYYFKENIVGTVAPHGWEYRKETVPDQKNVLVIPGLQKLSEVIDKDSVEI